jgi:hypothetical protein
LHTLDDVRERFAGVPIELAEHSPHFPSLRLLTTSTCRMHCQYPGEQGLLWCHNEGLQRNGIPEADLPTMLKVVAHLRSRYGIREVVLAGLQPRLDAELLWFIGALHQAGIDKVSMTSHGLKLLDWLPWAPITCSSPARSAPSTPHPASRHHVDGTARPQTVSQATNPRF